MMSSVIDAEEEIIPAWRCLRCLVRGLIALEKSFIGRGVTSALCHTVAWVVSSHVPALNRFIAYTGNPFA